jgi:hypothetical protein
MQMAITFMAVVAGLIFSVAVALLAEELIFGQVFRLFFARQAVPVKPGRSAKYHEARRRTTMLALKYLLITGGLGMILVAMSILAYDLYRELMYRRPCLRRRLERCRRCHSCVGAHRWRWRCWRGDRCCWRSALWWCRAEWPECA